MTVMWDVEWCSDSMVLELYALLDSSLNRKGMAAKA